MTSKGCSILCGVLGINELILKPEGQPLEKRLLSQKKYGKMKMKIKNFYAMGQNLASDSIPDIAKNLLLRDYPTLANF